MLINSQDELIVEYMNELDKKTMSLNQSGAFLQFHVLNELTKRQWATLVETPVTIAPFDSHPEKHPLIYKQLMADRKIPADKFSQAVLESQNKAMREETSVDIDAQKLKEIQFENYNINFRLCIEVKKNDPRYSDWCFFQHKKNNEPMRLIQKTITRRGLVDLFQITESDKYGNPIFVQTYQYHRWKLFEKEIADFGLALQNKEVNRDYYRSEKTKVDEAARQIIKGTYGLIIEKLIHQVTKGEGYTHNPDIFIPIIITNANLFLCKFNLKDIDPITGQITKDPEYEPVDSIIYEYPKPKEVQFPNTLDGVLSAELRDHVSKWHVLVMNPKGFSEFLDEIEENIDIL